MLFSSFNSISYADLRNNEELAQRWSEIVAAENKVQELYDRKAYNIDEPNDKIRISKQFIQVLFALCIFYISIAFTGALFVYCFLAIM